VKPIIGSTYRRTLALTVASGGLARMWISFMNAGERFALASASARKGEHCGYWPSASRKRRGIQSLVCWLVGGHAWLRGPRLPPMPEVVSTDARCRPLSRQSSSVFQMDTFARPGHFL
jgi:hypothetical protein